MRVPERKCQMTCQPNGRPSVTDFMEGLVWDPTPSVPVAAWCKPFVGHCEHFGHAFRCDFGDAHGTGLALLVVG